VRWYYARELWCVWLPVIFDLGGFHNLYMWCNNMLSTKIDWPDSPRSGLSVVAAQTVRACVESIRVTPFLRDLLTNSTRLTRKLACYWSRPAPYINEVVRSIDATTIDQSNLCIIFTLFALFFPFLWSRSNLALVLVFLDLFLHLFFGPTSSRGVLGGMSTPKQPMYLSSPTGSLSGGEIWVLSRE
jgi:hypothetical protein